MNMSMGEFIGLVKESFPDATLDVGENDQLIIRTGLYRYPEKGRVVSRSQWRVLDQFFERVQS